MRNFAPFDPSDSLRPLALVCGVVLVLASMPAAAADRILLDEEFERPIVNSAATGVPITGWTWTASGSGTGDVMIEPQGSNAAGTAAAANGSDGAPTGQFINPTPYTSDRDTTGSVTLSTGGIGAISALGVTSQIYRRSGDGLVYRTTLSDATGVLTQVNAPPNGWFFWEPRSVNFVGEVSGDVRLDIYAWTGDTWLQRSYAIDQVRLGVTTNLARWTGASPYADGSRLTDGCSAIQGANTAHWDDRPNWEQGGKPTAGDDVVFAGGSYTQIAGNGKLQTTGTIAATQNIVGPAAAILVGSITLGTASEDTGAAVDAFGLTLTANLTLSRSLAVYKNDALSVNNGTLVVGTTTYLGTGATLTVGDGTGAVGSATLAASGAIANKGSLILAGDDAHVTMAAGLANIGSVQVNAGTLDASGVTSMGSFSVAGSGLLNLTGANTFSTLAAGGTIVVHDGGCSVASSLTNIGNFMVGDGTGAAGTAALTAQGGLINAGTLVVQGDDGMLTVTGSLTAQAGSAGFVRGGQLTADALSLAANSALMAGDGSGAAGTATLTVNGDLANAGVLTLAGPDGVATIGGVMSSATGSTWTVNGGSLLAASMSTGAMAAIQDGTATVKGLLTNTGTLVVGDGTGDVGTAALVAQGGLNNTGVLTLAGVDASATVTGMFSSTTGSTLAMNAGRLTADAMSLAGTANLAGGRLDVATMLTVADQGEFNAAGGLLLTPTIVNHGRFNNLAGAISSDAFANTGRLVLAAGSSATFTQFSQSAAGTLILDCASTAPLMTVTGGATLGGSVAFANTGSLAFTSGNQVLMDLVGSCSGAFANVKDGTVIRRAGLANYVYSSRLGDGNDIGVKIKYTDFHEIGQALVPALDTGLAMTRSVMDIQSDRLWTARQDGLLRNPAHIQADQATALDDIDAGPMDAAYDAKEEWSFYALAKGMKMDLDAGAKVDLTTAAVGGDLRPSKTLLAGVLCGYSDGHYAQASGSGDQTGLTLAVYAAWQFLPSFWLDAQLGYSRLDLDTRREMIGGTLAGSTSGSTLAYAGRVVWQAMDQADPATGVVSRLAPFVGIRFADLQLDGFTEQGLQPTQVAGLDASTWEASAGVQWSQLFPRRTISYSTWGYHLRAELFTGDASGGAVTTTDPATSAALSANQWGGVGSGHRGTAGLDFKWGGWGFSADLTHSQASEAASWSVQVQAGCLF